MRFSFSYPEQLQGQGFQDAVEVGRQQVLGGIIAQSWTLLVANGSLLAYTGRVKLSVQVCNIWKTEHR